MPDSTGTGTTVRGLLAAAALVVIIAGLQAAGDILLPIVLSVFLSVLALPGVRFLQRLRVPTWIAIPLVVLAVAGVLVAVTGVVANTVRGFTTQIPKYYEPFNALVLETLDQFDRIGIAPPNADDLVKLLQPADVMTLLGQTLNALLGVLQQIVVVTLTMTFILFEANDLAKKSAFAFGGLGEGVNRLREASANIQRYLFIKTVVSLATGLLVMVWVSLLGLDFPVMWGLIAFVFNYIPSIGSILAAIPAVLLAIVQLGFPGAVGVALGFIVVNVGLGNFLEPRLLGRSLGLSPLVVFLSLLFWGWMWGPAGMLICVPLTVIAKLILEGHEDTQWIAVFLGSVREVDEATR